MKATTILLGLAALAVAAGPAHAQWVSGHLTMQLAAPEAVLTTDHPFQVIKGDVRFTGDPTAYTNVVGIPIQYHVTQAPPWATVVITPRNDVLPINFAGWNYESYRPLNVVVIAQPNWTGDAHGMVEITGTTRPGSGSQSVTGTATVPIAYKDTREPCPTEPLFIPLPPDESIEAESDELTVQSANQLPTTSWGAVAGFGLVGAGVGLVLRRRLV